MLKESFGIYIYIYLASSLLFAPPTPLFSTLPSFQEFSISQSRLFISLSSVCLSFLPYSPQ